MGNIEIREQNHRNRRTNIFSDRKSITPSKNYYPQTARSPRSYTPKNQRTTIFSPIRFSNINTANSNNEEILITERKANTSFPNTSRLYDGLEYSQLNNLAKKLDVSTTNKRQNRQFLNKISTIQYKQNQEDQSFQKYPKTQRAANPGRIVPNFKIKQKTIKQILTESTPKYKSNEIESENILQNKQIIKKVRNFNDFLNQIKRKLKEDKQKNLIRNKSNYKYIPKLPRNASNLKENATKINDKTKDRATKQNIFSPRDLNRQQTGQSNTIQKDRSTRRLQVALKLENQKLELQKYRKLVERQLSKTHSIENIFLQTKPSGEKILTIQYQTMFANSNFRDKNNNTQNQNSKSNFSKETSKKSLIHDLSDKNYQKISKSNQKPQQNEGKVFSKITIKQKINNILNQKPRKNSAQQQKNISQQILLNKLKSQYQSTLNNLLQLGRIIQQYQNRISQPPQKSSLQQSNKQKPSLSIVRSKASSQQPNKIQKIQNLFKKLSDIQQKYQQTDRQIKNMIQLEQQNSQSQLQSREIGDSSAKENSYIEDNERI